MLFIGSAVVPAAANRAVNSPGNVAEASAHDTYKSIGSVDTTTSDHRGGSGS